MMEPAAAAAALGLIMGGGAVRDDAAELELGLSLGSGGGSLGKMRRPSRCGSSSSCGGGGGARILTAKDFPNGFPSVRPAAAAAVSGMKRAADGPYVGSPPTASSQVVGWPPIGAYRMNTLGNANTQSKLSDDDEEEDDDEVVEEVMENSKKKMSHGFVKVNMDGHPIGRKVDLIAHTSYKTLAQQLEDMFFKPTPKTTINSTSNIGAPSKHIDKHSSEFVLTYEDKDGDWMLVGDVPWGMFLSTVKRLRIMRTSESNGLGMDSHI